VAESRIALSLPKAMEQLDAAGEVLAGIVVTGPPRAGRGEGVPRVIRERHRPDGVELTVAFPVPPKVLSGRS